MGGLPSVVTAGLYARLHANAFSSSLPSYLVQAHSFARLPLDNKLYRLVGAGKVLPKNLEMATARVQLWFAEVDVTDTANLGYARRANGEVSLLAVDEAAGSLPAYPLGSYWQDGTLQSGLWMSNQVKVERAYISPQNWRLMNARDCVGLVAAQGSASFPLQGDDVSGKTHRFGDAPVLICETASGEQLLIPSYEIFRRFYGVCSTLSNALLGGHWQRELDQLIDRDHTGMSDDAKHFELLTKKDISSIGCRAIALFEECEFAKAQAQGIYPSLVNARREQRDDPWIKVIPPWQGNATTNEGGMGISFIGHQLANGVTLVLWIYDSHFPRLPRPLMRVFPEVTIPVYDDARDNCHSERSGLQVPEDPGQAPIALSVPADTKFGKHIAHLAIQESWSDLPTIPKRYITRRFVSASPQAGIARPKRRRQLSTGHVSEMGHLNSASLSGDEHNKIKDRFRALGNSFEQLLQEGFLLNRRDYALCRPSETNGATYCELPSTLGSTPISWAIIGTAEGLRSRLCWVSELELADGSFRYFFDLEAQEWEGFYAMVLKFTNQEEMLDERTLDEIFKRAVANQGRWKKVNWASIQGRATFRLVQHKITDGMIDLKHLKAGLA